jgi:F-type H+-transporting ATPase subunit b
MSMRGLSLVLLGVLMVLLSPSAVQAADPGGSNPLFPPRVDLTLWTIVVFVVLLLVLQRFAWGPMVEGLKKRESHIRLAVDEAKLAREETERLRAQFKTEMDQAFAKIPQMMEEARRSGEKLAEEMRAKATADIAAERQRSHRELTIAKDQALQELTTHVAQLATLISAKAIGRTLSSEDHTRLIDEALSEIHQAAHK